jgi:hypothetical protein
MKIHNVLDNGGATLNYTHDNGVFVDLNANREIKAGMFAAVFNREKSALSAYNALTGSNYPPDTPVKIVTLTNVLYKGRVNDLAFLLGDRLVVLIEHQSTINVNIPLRLLIYIAYVYNAIYKGDSVIYGVKPITLREPEFYVLYNGKEKTKPVDTKRLSDLYTKYEDTAHEFNLDLKVTIYDVNAPENAEMISRSSDLSGYVFCIQRIYYYQTVGESDENAIRNAIIDTKHKGFLIDFLEEFESEVINMLFQEFSLERYGAVLKEEGLQEGRKLSTMVLKLLGKGKTPSEISREKQIPLDDILAIKREFEED